MYYATGEITEKKKDSSIWLSGSLHPYRVRLPRGDLLGEEYFHLWKQSSTYVLQEIPMNSLVSQRNSGIMVPQFVIGTLGEGVDIIYASLWEGTVETVI